MPFRNAGSRNEPPPSLPIPNRTMPVATATASPPELPPGDFVASHGLMVCPASSLYVCMPRALRVGMFAWAIGVAPAARSRATIGASDDLTLPVNDFRPCVVAAPATSMLALTENTTPASGPSGTSGTSGTANTEVNAL